MRREKIPFSPPDISYMEIEEVVDTLKSGWITTGPKTKKLEFLLSEVTNTPKTVCLNSATAALELVLRILGVGKGDEVIVPAMTYTASCSVIQHVGATPVIIDIQQNTFEMDYDMLETKISSKTKVIIPVELSGIICDYDKIYEIVNKKSHLFTPSSKWQKVFNRIILLSDSAHAFGARYKNKIAGEIADFTTFSFHAVKNFTTGEGGSVTWRLNEKIDNEELYNEFQIYSLHGQTKDALSKTKLGSWEYDILLPGYKCNMTDIMASLGLAQLKRYPELLSRRSQIVKLYDAGFKNTSIIPLNHFGDNYTSSMHLYITHIVGINIDQRNKIIKEMANRGIACNVHYKPLPMLKAYKDLGFDIKNYPNSYKFYENEITLPLHTLLSDSEIDYIIKSFKEVVEVFNV